MPTAIIIPKRSAPPLRLLLGEAGPLASLHLRRRADRAAAVGRDGRGRNVLVIPGFLTGDRLTRRLRATLDLAGYNAHGWGLGANWGARADLLDRLGARLESLGGPVSLVGWSLGGLYARELAKRRPELVDRVVTLGSPFSGDMRSNRAWRLYELINDHAVDRPPIAVDLPAKPPVPTFALWSRADGIVAPTASHGLPGEADRCVEVACHHMNFVTARRAIVAILDALEEKGAER